MIKNIILAILMAMTWSVTQAQIVTDRPDQTESSSTIDAGALQIESGILVAYEGGGAYTRADRQILLPTTLLRFGITEKVELRLLSQLESQRIFDRNFDGISDLEIGTKIQLVQDESKRAEMAFLSHLVLPTGTYDLSGGTFGIINKFSASYSFKNFGLGYNAGFNYLGEGIDLTYSLALGTSLNDKISVYAEPYGQLTEFEEFVLNFDAGFTYLSNENLQFDFSFGTGISHRMNYISVGVSWLIKKS